MSVCHCSQADESIAVSLLGNKNSNKDAVTPDSFPDLFPGHMISNCLPRKLFSHAFPSLSRPKEVRILWNLKAISTNHIMII